MKIILVCLLLCACSSIEPTAFDPNEYSLTNELYTHLQMSRDQCTQTSLMENAFRESLIDSMKLYNYTDGSGDQRIVEPISKGIWHTSMPKLRSNSTYCTIKINGFMVEVASFKKMLRTR